MAKNRQLICCRYFKVIIFENLSMAALIVMANSWGCLSFPKGSSNLYDFCRITRLAGVFFNMLIGENKVSKDIRKLVFKGRKSRCRHKKP